MDKWSKIYFENLDESAKWHKINTVMKIFVENIKNNIKEHKTNFQDVFQKIVEEINSYGLESSEEEVKEIINELVENGFINLKDGGNGEIFITRTDPDDLREIAIKFNLYNYIKKEFEDVLEKDNYDGLKNLLSSYNKILEKYKFIPTETRYPILKAICLMDNEKIEKIKKFLNSKVENSLELAIFLVLNEDDPKIEELLKEYNEKFQKNLHERNYYYVTAEFSVLAGGLGRVGQFLLPFIKSFGVSTIVIEPYYRYDIHGREIDYEKISNPLKFTSNNPDKIYEIYVHRTKVKVLAYKGKNFNGVDVWLIRDENWFYTKQIYRYNDGNFPTIFQFTEFFSKAALELIEELEKEKKEKLEKEKKQYRDAIIHCNDGQTSLLSLFRELYYKNTAIENAYIHFTTHTYINRIKNFDKKILYDMDIPEEYFWAFLRKEKNNIIFDFSSCGIRISDGANAVSAVHRENILDYDPLSFIYGITNGDYLKLSSKYFTNESPYNLNSEKILEIKKKAKENLSLDPEKIVISYSGRYVDEKNGRKRAFVNENIEKWVKEGAQIVIYGNYMQDHNIREFKILKEKFEKQKDIFKGNFIFKDKFDIEEQRKLLAATDLQIQDSDYNTEAAGYTEADVSSCAGLQMAPPYLEGILQQQGIILKRNIPGEGNTIIPKYKSPESYRESVLWLIRKYNEKKDNDNDYGKRIIGEYQHTSLKISKILNSAITAMDYLNIFNDELDKKSKKNISRRNFDHNLSKNEVEIENFKINYDSFSNLFKIFVYVNQNSVDSKFVNVYLRIRNKGEILKIPFKLIESGNKLVYELLFSKEYLKNLNSPLIKCKIIATSGLWNDEREIFLLR